MEVASKRHEKEENADSDFIDILKFFIYSSIGIFAFFIPIKLNGQSTTLIYHIAYKLQDELRPFIQICIIIFSIIGCLKPIIENKKKKVSRSNIFLYVRMFSIIIIANIFYGKNTNVLLDNNIVLLIDELVLNVATVLPLSAIFITFLLDYGFLDIVESYFQNIMKKNFKLSGKTIVNILIYICTDCFCGMFVTNKLYKTGKIRYNEACIIILNFSIMSIHMIGYISNELNIDKVDIIIVSTITLIVTNIILSRMYPLSKKKKSYYIKTNYKETIHKNEKLKNGIKKYLKNKNNKNIIKTIIDNLEEAISVIINLIPELVMILYLGNIILNSDIILELSKYIFYPLAEIFKIADKGEMSVFGINLFYNNIIGIENVSNYTQYSTKFLVGILAITSCTSLSSNMVYIKNTDISITKKEFLISYIQKIITIVFIYSIMYYFYRGYMM
jgi:nucleoside recognition membrane protein YjiH